MFYSDAILSKKGALAKVWLAAHMESRLTKGQVGSVDVEQSVKDIMQEQAEPMALRLSGQLLLGVCRIYSRKAKYLLDDCNDALVTIRMQIRPALVDLPDDQLAARSHDLDLDDTGDLGMEIDWDMPLPAFDFGDESFGAPQRQITLSSAHARRLGLNDNVRNFDVGPSDGFASQDFDLGLDMGEDDDDDTVELGRHDSANLSGARLSLGGKSLLNDSFSNAGDLSRPSLGGGARGAMDMDVDFDDQQPIDLGLDIGSPRMDYGGMGGQPDADDYAGGMDGMDFDMGGGFDVPPNVPDLVLDGEGQRSRSRESSRLSTPPAEIDESTASIAGNLTPRTAALVSAMANKADRAAAAAAAADTTPTGPKKKKTVRVIVDEMTELDSQGLTASQAARRNKDLSAILQPQRFIPGSAAQLQFDQIRQDPLAFYLPTRTRSDGELVLYAGPPALGPELAQMFEFPVSGILRRRRDGDVDDEAARKRQRLEAGELDHDDDDIELGRRDERAKSVAAGDGTFDFGGMGGQPDDHLDFGGMGGQPDDDDRPFNPDDPSFDDYAGGMDDYNPEAANFLDDQLVLDDGRSDRARSVISERSGQSGASNGPRGARRARAGSSRGGSASRSLGADDDEETESQRVREKQRALGLLKEGLGRPAAVEGEFEFIDNSAQEKVVDFKTVHAKSSRKAAAGFFFELLVLGTKDAIKLSQATAYGDIEVRAKERLFDVALTA